MADTEAPLRHLKTYPTDGPLSAADVADHQVEAGTVPDGWALRARDAATHKLVWTDDGGADRNNPLRAVLIGDSAEIVNTAAVTLFNKSLTILAGAANIQGAMIRIHASGKYSSRASAPGQISFFLMIGAQNIAIGYSDLLGGLTDQGWVLHGEALVRTTGASASVMPANGYMGTYPGDPAAEGVRPSAIASPVTLDLTVALGVTIAIQFSAADPGNKATLRTMSLEICLPGVVVT